MTDQSTDTYEVAAGGAASDTHASVRDATNAAATSEALDQAVASSHAAAAPSDEIGQFMAQVHSRLSSIESVIARFSPMMHFAESIASATVPGAKPIVARINDLEGFASDLFNAIDSHFGGKIALPPPPVPPGAGEPAPSAG